MFRDASDFGGSVNVLAMSVIRWSKYHRLPRLVMRGATLGRISTDAGDETQNILSPQCLCLSRTVISVSKVPRDTRFIRLNVVPIDRNSFEFGGAWMEDEICDQIVSFANHVFEMIFSTAIHLPESCVSLTKR